jgi:hypothetical protein
VLDLAGLPTMAPDCLNVAEFLAWESHNVTWKEDDSIERMEQACKSARASIAGLQKRKKSR